MADFETWITGLIAQESGDNYDAVGGIDVPGQGRALGKYQIMPGNWKPWSERILGYEGDINSPQDQDTVARGILKDYHDKYGDEGALVAWYAGESNGQRWKDGEPDAIGEGGHYSWDAVQDGNAPSVRQYVQEALSKQTGHTSGKLWDLSTTSSPFGTKKPIIPTAEQKPVSFGDYMGSKFTNAFYDNALTGLGRIGWAGRDTVQDVNYVPTKEEYEQTLKALPNDPQGQRWALMNSQNPEQLRRLVYQKQQDAQREKQIQDYKGNWVTNVAGFGASLAGGVIGDPTVLIPVIGQQAMALRMVERLGVTVSAGLKLNKVIKYADIGVQQSAMAVASRKGAEVYGGFEQNYEMAGALGFVAGAGLSALGGHLAQRASLRSSRGIIDSLNNMEDHAISMGMDVRPPSEIPPMRESLNGIHDASYVASSGSSRLAKLVDDGKVQVISRSDIEAHAVNWGIDPAITKAFHIPEENLTVLIKDNIVKGDKIDNILSHEIGVHANLKDSMGDSFSNMEEAVKAKMKNPDKSWREAIQANKTGDWEETLGHWIEKNVDKKDPISTKIKGLVSQVFGKEGTKGMSNAEIRGFVLNSLQKELEKSQGYRTLPDGSVIMNGNIKFSATNIFNPNNISHMIEMETPTTMWGKVKKSVSNWTENGWYYRTPQGVLGSSPAKIAQRISKDLLEDARMRGKNSSGTLPAESQKAHIKTQLDSFQEKYIEARLKALTDDSPIKGVATFDKMQEFNEQVGKYYNATYSTNRSGLDDLSNVSQGVKDCAKIYKDAWDKMVQFAKSSGEMFGEGTHKNMIGKDVKFLDGEMWRRIDDRKWLDFVNKFAADKDSLASIKAQAFLHKYAMAYIKRDIVKGRLEAEAKALYDLKMAEWHTLNDSLAEGVKPTRKPPKRTITDAMVEKEVTKHAESWSKGVSDQNLSNLDRFKGKEHSDLGLGEFIESRVPMDTSGTMVTPWGETFSYDNNLRSFNFDQIIPRTFNRFAGELALNNKFTGSKGLVDTRAKLAQALEHGTEYKMIGDTTKARNLEAFDEAITQIRGVRRDKDYRSLAEGLSQILRGISYSTNGSHFGANQVGELGGAIGVAGFKAINHFIPAFASFMRDVRMGKGGAELADIAEKGMFGANVEHRIWGGDFRTTFFQDSMQDGSLAKVLDGVNTVVVGAGKITSTFNLLPKLTNLMLKGLRKDAIMDTVRWADGHSVGVIRNPFSKAKLEGAGIPESMVNPMKEAIKKYMPRDAEGKLGKFDMDNWVRESPDTFWKFKTLVDNQSKRAMVQNTVGNRSLLINQNFGTKMLMQFKDFSMKTMNSQVMRMITHRELDDLMSLMFGMATNSAVYAGLTYGKSFTMYGDNESARQDYLKRSLSPQRLMLAGVLRGVIGAGLSTGTDIYEAMTGADTFRTSVRRDLKPPKDTSVQMRDPIAQLPAVKTASNILETGESAYRLATANKASKRDVKQLFSTVPLSNSIPMLKLSEVMAERSGLPEKVSDNSIFPKVSK